MREAQHTSRQIRAALAKLSLSFLLLLTLLIGGLSSDSRAFQGIIFTVLFVLVIPVNVLLSIDASRTISKESHLGKSTIILGRILGVPQAILGLILIAAGIVYSLVGLRNIFHDLTGGAPATLDLIWTLIALSYLVLGYFYFRQSLVLIKHRPAPGK